MYNVNSVNLTIIYNNNIVYTFCWPGTCLITINMQTISSLILDVMSLCHLCIASAYLTFLYFCNLYEPDVSEIKT